MSRLRANPFQVTRNGEPIENVHIRDSVDPHISFSMGFQEWEAAIAAGATLDELLKWDQRGYPKEFMAKVIAWYQNHTLVKAHLEDASRPKRKGR